MASLTSQPPSWAERLGLLRSCVGGVGDGWGHKWEFKSSLEERLRRQAGNRAAWQPKTLPGSRNANRAQISLYVGSSLGSWKLSAGVPGVSGGPARTFVSQHTLAGETGRKDPQKICDFNPSLRFPSVFSAVCRNGRRAGGLLKAPTPVPPLPYHFPMSAFLFSYTTPPPPLSSPPCYFLLPLLFLPSSVVLSFPSFPKRAPRPSELQRVTQTVHCLTSTSTSTSCLGRGGGWVVVHSSPGSSRPLGSKSGTRLTLRPGADPAELQIWWKSEGSLD